MNELKPEDVMRALECCDFKAECDDCPYVGRCWDLNRDALALLREKDAEIERLKKHKESVSTVCNRANEHYNTLYEQAKEILKAEARAEAITEFALRLKSCEFYEVADQYDGMQYIDFCDWVDKIANEMKG